MREKTIRHVSVDVLSAWLFLFFTFFVSVRAYVAETRVFNQVDLFSVAEKQELERQTTTEREKTKLDLVVAATNQAGGKSAEAHADGFYDQGGCGCGTKRSGVLYLIGIDSRRIHVGTADGGIQLLSGSEIEKLLDLGTPDVKSGNHAESASRVLPGIQDSHRKAQREGWAYDVESGVWTKKKHLSPLVALGFLAASLVVTLGAATGVKRNYKMQDGETRRASTVVDVIAASGAAFGSGELSDRLPDRNRVKRRIHRSSGGLGGGRSSRPRGSSPAHTGSGGSSHGGGGRSF